MPKLTINGREIEVEAGTTVIQAAQKLGVFVPHYCYHPGLTVAGNCRMCLVEVEKMPKLAISCSTIAGEGMVVRTDSPKVKEAQDAILEFLLINHPLDCPICDQAGECKLQEFAFEFGPARSRFLEEKVHKPKSVDLGEHIVFDGERCILCSRCVRFCQEITKTGELTISHRADHATIETYPGMRLDNAYSGNTVDICPVGALTLKEFRFRQRVWFLKEVPSVCAGCARGCNVLNGVSKGKILRITPRENLAVNAWWICDEGRLSYEKLAGPSRIRRARVEERFRAAGRGVLKRAAAPAPAAGAWDAGPAGSAIHRDGRWEGFPAGEGLGGSFEDSTTPGSRNASMTSGASDAGGKGGTGGAGGKGGTGGVARSGCEALDEVPFIPRPNEGVPLAPGPGHRMRPGELPMGPALDAAARVLDDARGSGANGPEAAGGAEGAVEFLLSPRATNEDIYALAKLARDLFGARQVGLPEFERGEDDELLIRKDRSPNSRGALAILEGLGIAAESAASLIARVRAGRVKAVVALGPNLMGVETARLSDPNPLPGAERSHHGAGKVPSSTGRSEEFAALVEAARSAGATLVAIDAFESPLTEGAPIVLPSLTYGEIEGSVTNFEGQVQRMRSGLAPGADGFPIYRIAQELGQRLGAEPARSGAQETFSALAAELPAFKGLSYAKLGERGAMLAGASGGEPA